MNRIPTARRLRSVFAVMLLTSALFISLAALRPTGVGAQVSPACYRVTALELTPGNGAQASFFTRNGHVLGTGFTADGQFHTFFYDGTTIHDLDAALNAANERFNVNEAQGLSEEGSVFGIAMDDSAGTQSAVIFDSTGLHRITLGGSFGAAVDINDAGQATGAATTDADNQILHAFRYDHGTLTDLGTLGGSRSYPNAISENGKVVGGSTNADGENHAFLYDDNGIHDLGVLPGGTWSTAFAVNNAGQVAGVSEIAGGGQHAFLYDGTTMLDLGILPGGVFSNATHINAAGHVAGVADASDNRQHIFLHDGTAMHNLTPNAQSGEIVRFTDSGILIGQASTPYTGFVYDSSGLHEISLGGSSSLVGNSFGGFRATNGSGAVAGSADTAGNTTRHAFLYDGDGIHDLNSQPGDYAEALGINEAGQVVGTNNNSAFLYSGGVMTNLNAFTCTGGILLNSAYGISDDGKILAADTQQGYLYLLTPSFDQPTTAEVSVGPALDVSHVSTGGHFTYTIYVTNIGPLVAADVTLTSQLPAGVTLDAITDDGGGSCSIAPGGTGLTCTFPSINPLTSNTVRVSATSNVAGEPYTPVTTSFTVTSTTPDDIPGNNTASIEFLIGAPPVPQPSPGPADDYQLAYRNYNSNNSQYDIFRRRADGAGLLNLTDSADWEMSFVWSPDGSRLAFSRFSNATSSSDVFVMDADGANLIRLTNTPDENDDALAWSPDGSRLAFTSFSTAGDYSVVRTINRDGTGLMTISPPGSHDDSPAWSPDGTRLSFLRKTYDETGNTSSNIYVADADGSNQIRLDNAANERDSAAVWSPDGARLAFLRLRTDATPSHLGDIYTVRPDGSDLQSLTSEHAVVEAPIQWSPDSSKLSFISNRAYVQSLDVVNADGSNLVTLISSTELYYGEERWSPDSSKIAYQTCGGECQNADIYIVNADGTGRRQLGDARERNFSPDWSPDGARLAFTSNRNGVASIDIINADGTGRVDLTNQASYYGAPKWRPRPQQQNTPAGTNVAVAQNGATLTFSNVTQAGQTTVTPIDPNSLQGIPGEYVINANSLAFEITTTAAYSGPITIGFQVPGINNPITFSALRVLHGEPPPVPNFVDRTILAPDSPTHDFPARTIYARVTSLSPFVIAERVQEGDTTTPDIQIMQPTNTVYLVNQGVTSSYSCTDTGGSGVATCAGTVANNGAAVNTASVGAKTFTVNATDVAGNPASKTVNYTVSYGVKTLHDATKLHKSGSTVQLELQLVNAANLNLSSAGVVVTAISVTRVSSSASGAVEEYNDDDPDSNFIFQNGHNSYRFKLKTTGYAAGTYLLSFRAGNDPTIHTVEFRIRQ